MKLALSLSFMWTYIKLGEEIVALYGDSTWLQPGPGDREQANRPFGTLGVGQETGIFLIGLFILSRNSRDKW